MAAIDDNESTGNSRLLSAAIIVKYGVQKRLSLMVWTGISMESKTMLVFVEIEVGLRTDMLKRFKVVMSFLTLSDCR